MVTTKQRLPLFIIITILLSLVFKLLLLQWNQGEYTDGIIQLQLWDSPVVFFPPGYGTLVYLLHFIVPDELIAARVVSIAASVMTLIVFYYLAQHILQNEPQAQWAVLFLALSPIFNRWSIRVMSDSLFCLGFVLCTYMLMLLWDGKSKRLCYLIGLTGLFALVRYQAFFFIPFIVWILYLKHRECKAATVIGIIKSTVIALTPWLLLAGWIFYRGFGHQKQFAERTSESVWFTLVSYWRMFETFVLYYPWAVTFGLFVCGTAGIVSFCSGNLSQKRFVLFFGIASFVFLIVQSAFLSFQYRYLLPLVPLWCLMAGNGADRLANYYPHPSWKRCVYGVVTINLIMMSVCVLYYQRSTFGALTESAEYLRVFWKNARVLSDESYGQHAANVKMQFWSERDILYIHEHDLRVGDVLIIHNTYTPDWEQYIEELKTKFTVEPIRVWNSENDPQAYTTIPLLPDIMVAPAFLDGLGRKFSVTSNPECMVYRFIPQNYFYFIIRLNEKR